MWIPVRYLQTVRGHKVKGLISVLQTVWSHFAVLSSGQAVKWLSKFFDQVLATILIQCIWVWPPLDCSSPHHYMRSPHLSTSPSHECLLESTMEQGSNLIYSKVELLKGLCFQNMWISVTCSQTTKDNCFISPWKPSLKLLGLLHFWAVICLVQLWAVTCLSWFMVINEYWGWGHPQQGGISYDCNVRGLITLLWAVWVDHPQCGINVTKVSYTSNTKGREILIEPGWAQLECCKEHSMPTPFSLECAHIILM